VFAPKRGLLANQWRMIKNRKQLSLRKTLLLMYGIAKTHKDISHPHNIKLLNDFQGFSPKALNQLAERGWAKFSGDQWQLTKKGYAHAQEAAKFKKDNI